MLGASLPWARAAHTSSVETVIVWSTKRRHRAKFSRPTALMAAPSTKWPARSVGNGVPRTNGPTTSDGGGDGNHKMSLPPPCTRRQQRRGPIARTADRGVVEKFQPRAGCCGQTGTIPSDDDDNSDDGHERYCFCRHRARVCTAWYRGKTGPHRRRGGRHGAGGPWPETPSAAPRPRFRRR